MPGRQIPETTLYLIRNHIQQNMAPILANVGSESPENRRYSLEMPRKYYFSERVNRNFEMPSIFIIPQNVDFMLAERGQNYINANVNIQLTCVLTDRDIDILAVKGMRYMAALQEVLHRAELQSVNGDVKIVVKVMSAAFTPVYTAAQAGTTANDFRHEISLDLEVNHWEQE